MARLSSAAAFMALLSALVLTPRPAESQTAYPSQTIKLIVPNPAGGLPDTVARIVGRRLQERLQQSVVVENRPGANGRVAVAALLSAPADGYTCSSPTARSSRSTRCSMPTWPTIPNDILPIAMLARAPLFLAVHPEGAGGNHERVHRLRESATRPDQLRLVRRRQHAPSVDGGDERRAQARHDPRAVQGHGRVGAGAARRPYRGAVLGLSRRSAAPPTATRSGCSRPMAPSARPRRPTCRPWPSSFRVSTSRR